ncbi:receptor-type tyrosine-protein kinase FLT3 [Platysternon megacephalum]|uniref:Receptor-type tyrosine-protein kinase FLT3 n=1 Tax=Platysternon megacephalum TaxID=55544 RepID=A0A4D9EXD9_9SAUR|nr:receptor-type tyrosine-protein kinase FLT3 [Platysternon megacephalum]
MFCLYLSAKIQACDVFQVAEISFESILPGQHQTAAVFGQSKRLTLAPPCEDALTILIIAALKKSMAYTKGSKMLLRKEVEVAFCAYTALLSSPFTLHNPHTQNTSVWDMFADCRK